MDLFNIPLLKTRGIISDHCVSVQFAAELTGYNLQYLRRLLRDGKLEGTKIGQIWLIDLASLQTYFSYALGSNDLRCGPKGAWQLPF